MRGEFPEWMRFLAKNWKPIGAVLPTVVIALVWYGKAEGIVNSIDDRVAWIEGTHPEATASLARQNADDNTEIRRRIDKLSDDASATRADVARLCEHFGLPSH